MNTLMVLLVGAGLSVAPTGPALSISDRSPDQVMPILRTIRDAGPVDSVVLAECAMNKESAKYDWALGEELLCLDYATRALDVAGTLRALGKLEH